MRLLRYLRKMFDHQRPTVVAAPPAVPPPPAHVTPRDRAELAQTRRRLKATWQTMDELLADFDKADHQMRLGPR